MLDAGDGQRLYWECCGNSGGKSALLGPTCHRLVVGHGGPGSGSTPQHRRFFDPEALRIVLFDQCGAGRRTPRVTATSDLSANTTGHLIDDIERLREHLGIDRWLVFGNYWGWPSRWDWPTHRERTIRAHFRRWPAPSGTLAETHMESAVRK